MRKSALLLALLLVGCASSKPDEPVAPAPSYIDSLALWNSVPTYPELGSDQFWAPDNPLAFEPLGFGTLPPEHRVFITRPIIGTYKLEATLPTGPTDLPVYVVGAYPANQLERIRSLPLALDDCGFVPPYSLTHCEGATSKTDSPIGSQSEAIERAIAAAGPLWLPDWRTETADQRPDGSWRVIFTQIIDGVPLFGDKPLQVRFNPQGNADYLLVRRRPLMAKALYPLRTPEDAWQQVVKGRAFGLTNIEGAESPSEVGHHALFTAVAVEIAYISTHANTDREILQPYYLFRDAQRRTLFVPAVAEPYVTWPL